MLNSILLNYMCGEPTRVESSTEDLLELLVKASDSQLLEIKVLFEDGFLLNTVGQNLKGLNLAVMDAAVEFSLIIQNSIAKVPQLVLNIHEASYTTGDRDSLIVKLDGHAVTPVDEHAPV
jgi:hypothetical protein